MEIYRVIGFYDSDYQRDIILFCCEEEVASEKEDGDCIGLQRLPSCDFHFRHSEEKHEVHIVASFGKEEIENNPDKITETIHEFDIFANNARMRFGQLILESAKTRELLSSEERRFFSTLMCTVPYSAMQKPESWLPIDMADMVRLEELYQSCRLIHIEGADSKEEILANIISALDGAVHDSDYLCLRYVFPEGTEMHGAPLYDLISEDKHNDVLIRTKRILCSAGMHYDKKSPAFSATVLLFSDRREEYPPVGVGNS